MEIEAEKKRFPFELDSDFFVDKGFFLEKAPQIEQLQKGLYKLEIRRFLSGLPDPKFEGLLELTMSKISLYAHGLSEEYKIDVAHAYKLLVGLIDRYDEEQIASFQRYKKLYQAASIQKLSEAGPKSSFVLRNAVLGASHKDGVGLESWQVFTKRGKPRSKGIWRFLDNSKNWVPEAQAVLAKFIEITAFNARNLAQENRLNRVVLLKGGFGAGKTMQANRLFGNESSGIIAPDKGKAVVRRSMSQVPHTAAHVQGSQVAYSLFDELIKKVAGTVVYDSSLSHPGDLQSYIEKAEKSGKKVVVYDMARNDIARILSVLKRSIQGEDPRIDPESILKATITDKIHRISCMNTILNHTSIDDAIKPEYHFIGADRFGTNSQEIIVLRSGNEIQFLQQDDVDFVKERLQLEGLIYNEATKSIESFLDEETLKAHLDEQFEKTVEELQIGLSEKEKGDLEALFSQRILLSPGSLAPIDFNSFYESLHESVKQSIGRDSFIEAFGSIKEETRVRLFVRLTEKLAKGESITYQDLPLRSALTIHAKLQIKPTIWPC